MSSLTITLLIKSERVLKMISTPGDFMDHHLQAPILDIFVLVLEIVGIKLEILEI